jgi:Bacteriocin-protection, YdeI or OmpD-Associated/Domain of unknown function (DUF1905)
MAVHNYGSAYNPRMTIPFESVLKQAEGMLATGIPVPDSVVAELGGPKNAPVTVMVRKSGSTADWFTYRISLSTRDGGYVMSFSSANRAASGLVAGDPLEVQLELDLTPREVVLPEDLSSALIAASKLDAFLALSYSKQRAIVEPIESAKGIDTRQRRVVKAVADLAG